MKCDKTKKLHKKIIFISEFLPDDKNSVAEIFNHLLHLPTLRSVEKIICLYNTNIRGTEILTDVKVFWNRGMRLQTLLSTKAISKKLKVFLLLDRIVAKTAKKLRFERRYRQHIQKFKYRMIIKDEKPDFVVFFIYTPDDTLLNLCIKKKTPYLQILYDTVVSSPEINIQFMKQLEERAIQNANGYFVPNFFFDDYLKYYQSKNLFSYNLPLLVKKEAVIHAYNSRNKIYPFTYFGQIQSFRNCDVIVKRMREIGMQLDVFSEKKIDGNDIMHIHPAVSGEQLWQIVAESRFLVAFDNSDPYAHYLPSKAYLYVSFTKPVIAFGDNEDSALLRFFKDYPYFYYQNINAPLDGLLNFMNRAFPDSFDETLYNRYLAYLPEHALRPIEKQINNLLGM